MPISDDSKEYQKLKMIGRGSFAAVYKVRHKTLGYIRAVKISNEQVESENDKAYKSFLKECKLLLQIGNGCHPNIVHIYQPRLINGRALVEMDYIEGMTLNEYVRENKFVPMKEFWKFSEGILSAVGYCHADLWDFLKDPDDDNLESDPEDGSKFLITESKKKELQEKYCVNHNDLHSNNIMRRHYDGSYVLLDFGLAIQRDQCVVTSSRGAGAHEYSSPEKLNGETISAASDVYSLGILMYEVLAGHVPFVLSNSGSIAEVSRLLERHNHETPAPIEPQRKAMFEATHPGEKWVKDYPDEVEAVVMRCLQKKPSDRYPNAKAALEALMSAKTMAERTVRNDDAAVSALKSDVARLTKENEELRERIKELEAKSDNTVFTSAHYKVGDVLNSGRICYVDSSGEHGLVLAARSQEPLSWLRKVDEEDYEKFTHMSKMWYKENCFIIPRGTHLPTTIELRNIMPNAKKFGLYGTVWVGSFGGSEKAFNLSNGQVADVAPDSLFMALKAF
ncbi:MAG: protein kinase [Firmicutes bacterium]|nr:protein kinase [Bacillota bacterium]MCM1401252.1 protein kinase [Bacteroides sp.]MCM1477199.1 protein kinase [Bacteroides sp.]